MFYFRLHPLQWNYPNDATTVFRALELADGTYLVSWQAEDGKAMEVIFTSEEVIQSLAEHQWIVEE